MTHLTCHLLDDVDCLTELVGGVVGGQGLDVSEAAPDLTAAECGGQGSPAAAAPHLLQAGVSGQGEGGGVEVEPVLPDVEGGHLAGLALHPAAGINS